MSTGSSVKRNQAMGLVKAAYASLKNSASLTKTEQEECHKEYDARRNDLACHGLQVIETSEGKLDFAAVHSPVEAHDKSLLIWPRGTGDSLASEPRPVGELTKLYSLESFLIGDSCCATKKLRTAGPEYIICGVSTDDGLDFCKTHQKFPTTQPVGTTRPVEWEGRRFAVGCETEGVKWFQPLADAHTAQHFAELGI